MTPPRVIRDIADISDLFEELDADNPFFKMMQKKMYVASTPFYDAANKEIELVFEKTVMGKEDIRYYVTLYHHDGTPYNTPMKMIERVEISQTSHGGEFEKKDLLARLDLRDFSHLTLYALHVAKGLVDKHILENGHPKPVYAKA